MKSKISRQSRKKTAVRTARMMQTTQNRKAKAEIKAAGTKRRTVESRKRKPGTKAVRTKRRIPESRKGRPGTKAVRTKRKKPESRKRKTGTKKIAENRRKKWNRASRPLQEILRNTIKLKKEIPDTGKVEEICELNKIKDPDNIKYGQKILLP